MDREGIKMKNDNNDSAPGIITTLILNLVLMLVSAFLFVKSFEWLIDGYNENKRKDFIATCEYAGGHIQYDKNNNIYCVDMKKVIRGFNDE